MPDSMFAMEAWADSWERRAPLVEQLVPPALDALVPAPGERILDVGTGLAPLAMAAARAVGPGGSVHGVDVSAPILARARERASVARLANVRFHQLDAESAGIPGAPFDAAASLLGVMFFADPVSAFANIRRHLRPGARVAFTAWAEPASNPLLAEVLLDEFAPGGLIRPDRGSFSLADAGRFAAILAEAGLDRVEISRRETLATVDAATLFDELLLDVYRVDDARRPAALLHVQETLRASQSSRGIVVPLAVHIATARSNPSLLED